MEALALWNIYPKADRAEVQRLVERLAAQLHIQTPPLQDHSVALPADQYRVSTALDAVEPDWRTQGLVYPPLP